MKSRRFGTLALLAIVAAVTSGALLAQAPQGIGTWVSVGEVGAALTNGAVVAMPDGRTLIAGGRLADGTLTDGVTIYDPVDNSVVGAGVLTSPRTGHTATLLTDGRVLVVGGRTADGLVFSDIEAFDPMTGTSTIVALLPEPRTGHVAAGLLDGTVLIAGGATTGAASLQTAVLFDPETASISSAAGGLQMPRLNASATTLLDGRVLVAGGSNGTAELASAEIYDRYSQTFTIAATLMSVGRQGHSAVILPNNGGVLVAGGTSNGVAQTGADLFLPAVFPDPFSYGEGEFASTGAMTTARAGAISGPTSVEGYAFTTGGGASDAEVYRFATIKTDKQDYPPGQRAIITGSGWQAGEDVTLVFQEDPAVHDDYTLVLKADTHGNVYYDQWAPEEHDLNVRFYLTARDSRSRAQTTFTDGRMVVVSVSAVGSAATITSRFFNSNNSCTGIVSPTTSSVAHGSTITVAGTMPSNQSVQITAATTAADGSTFSGWTVVQSAGSNAILVDLTQPTLCIPGQGGASHNNQGTYTYTANYSTLVSSTTTTLSCPASVTYDGSAQTPCSATVTGGGLNQSVTVTYTDNINAGTATATATFPGDATHSPSSDSRPFTINKADAVCSITGHTGAYDGAIHGAFGSCTGVAADPTAAGSSLNLGATYTDAPGGTAHWTFSGGTNYNDQTGEAAIVITKADAIVSVSGYNGTYDASPHSATGTATGVNGVDLSANLDFGDSFTNAPGGTANWLFNGGTNYNNQSGSVVITISKADAVCTINGYIGTYDGTAHGASGSCTGVDAGAAAGSTLDLGASFTNVPGGTASWSFSGGTNYNDQSGSVDITLGKANAIVTVNGYTGVFDAQAHGATGTAVGVMSESLAGLNLGGTFTNVPGGTAHWTFTDVTGNYNNDSGDAAIVITKADPHVTVNGYSGVYNGQPHGAYGHASGVLGEALPGLNLGASFTNVPGGTAHWTFTDQTGNYSNASGDAQIVIYKAEANCSITGYDVMFDNAFHTATGTCTGVTGASLSGLNLSATTHKDAGVYTDSWTFTDVTGNYNDTNGSVGDRIGHWTASGFYQPVDMSGTQIVWNTVKGGSTVPLKFNLYAGALKKTNVADVLGFAFAPMECGASALASDVEFTTTGGTSLRYDGTAGQFIQNWQTPKTPGTCFAVQLTAQEQSTTIVAYFKLK